MIALQRKKLPLALLFLPYSRHQCTTVCTFRQLLNKPATISKHSPTSINPTNETMYIIEHREFISLIRLVMVLLHLQRYSLPRILGARFRASFLGVKVIVHIHQEAVSSPRNSQISKIKWTLEGHVSRHRRPFASQTSRLRVWLPRRTKSWRTQGRCVIASLPNSRPRRQRLQISSALSSMTRTKMAIV